MQTTLTFTSSTNSIEVSWQEDIANYYRLYSSTTDQTNQSHFDEIYKGSTPTYLYSNLTSGIPYYFKLQLCVDSNIASCNVVSFMNGIEYYTLPNSDADFTLTLTATDSAITASWQVQSGSYYHLMYSNDNNTFNTIYSGNLDNFDYTGLTANTQYYFKLQICSSAIMDSCLSVADQQSQSVFTKPILNADYTLTLTAMSNSIDISWDVALLLTILTVV